MSGDLVTAGIGLVGAVIGSASTAVLSLRQQKGDAQRERERRNAEAEFSRQQREEVRLAREREITEHARVAARILQSDIAVVYRRLRRAESTGKFWGERFALPLDAWPQFREIIAKHMPLEDWKSVSASFGSFQTTELQAEAAREASGLPRPALTTLTKRQIALSLRRAKRGLDALERFSGDATERLDDDAEGEDMPGDAQEPEAGG